MTHFSHPTVPDFLIRKAYRSVLERDGKFQAEVEFHYRNTRNEPQEDHICFGEFDTKKEAEEFLND